MCGRSYRPRPANGSGDSPRPPFLSEFVNHIGKLSLVEVVYHLFGGTLATRVHPHVERSIRLKLNPRAALSSCRLLTPMSASRPSALRPRTSAKLANDRFSSVTSGQSSSSFRDPLRSEV